MKQEQTISVPDIGGVSGVDVIEIMVSPGDEVQVDTPLLTLESDKASMEIPSPVSGKIVNLLIKVGDKVSEGDQILNIAVENSVTAPSAPHFEDSPGQPDTSSPHPDSLPRHPELREGSPPQESSPDADGIYAGPGVRRLAREFGVDLTTVAGSGRKARITRDDILSRIKSASVSNAGVVIAPVPEIDFSQFGPIEVKPLNKIKRLTAKQVHQSWVSIPHVTQFGEADITDLEAFRQTESKQAEASGYKLTLLAFVLKALSKILIEFPQFNASLGSAGETLIYKQYVNIGIAVDTPNGLVVPVVKNVTQLTIVEIAKEMGRLSSVAREKGPSPADLKGGTFTVSSLGGIGGTAFTPIVNAPEVAILGLSKAELKPVYEAGNWVPKLMLPMALSYDHRVIDGAEGARFMKHLSWLLNDVRRILL